MELQLSKFERRTMNGIGYVILLFISTVILGNIFPMVNGNWAENEDSLKEGEHNSFWKYESTRPDFFGFDVNGGWLFLLWIVMVILILAWFFSVLFGLFAFKDAFHSKKYTFNENRRLKEKRKIFFEKMYKKFDTYENRLILETLEEITDKYWEIGKLVKLLPFITQLHDLMEYDTETGHMVFKDVITWEKPTK